MIDAGDDEPERFSPAREPAVRAAIASHLRKQQKRHPLLVGFAGAADGGDILFHECCHDLGVPTEVFLPVPDRQYRATAIRAAGSGATWLHRYVNVLENSGRDKVHTLNPAVGLPSWVDLRRDASSWPRTNRWILHHAFARTDGVTLLALWDGQPSRGPGGVSHMLELAQAFGAGIDIIDIKSVDKTDGDTEP